jgi:hypothetical protein
LELQVVLSYPKLGIVGGRTRDLGRGGMFVDTGRVTVPRDEKLRVYLHLPGPDAEHFCVAEARVVHSRGGGVGLAFQQLDDATRNTLAELMAAPDPAGDAALPGRPASGNGYDKGLEIPP